jgi:hypothetical protein
VVAASGGVVVALSALEVAFVESAAAVVTAALTAAVVAFVIPVVDTYH